LHSPDNPNIQEYSAFSVDPPKTLDRSVRKAKRALSRTNH
jgi:hypothetical protein